MEGNKTHYISTIKATNTKPAGGRNYSKSTHYSNQRDVASLNIPLTSAIWCQKFLLHQQFRERVISCALFLRQNIRALAILSAIHSVGQSFYCECLFIRQRDVICTCVCQPLHCECFIIAFIFDSAINISVILIIVNVSLVYPIPVRIVTREQFAVTMAILVLFTVANTYSIISF